MADYSITQLVAVPPGTRVLIRDEKGRPDEIAVLAFALCDVDDGGEHPEQQLCGVFACDGLELCEEAFPGSELCCYLAPGEKVTAALKRTFKLK